jgi:hypothetical protein
LRVTMRIRADSTTISADLISHWRCGPEDTMILCSSACTLAEMDRLPEAMAALKKAWDAG